MIRILTKYYSCDLNKKNDKDKACCTYGGEETCVQRFVARPGRKKPLGPLVHRWEGNTKVDF